MVMAAFLSSELFAIQELGADVVRIVQISIPTSDFPSGSRLALNVDCHKLILATRDASPKVSSMERSRSVKSRG
jgi:hypothetical protein